MFVLSLGGAASIKHYPYASPSNVNIYSQTKYSQSCILHFTITKTPPMFSKLMKVMKYYLLRLFFMLVSFWPRLSTFDERERERERVKQKSHPIHNDSLSLDYTKCIPCWDIRHPQHCPRSVLRNDCKRHLLMIYQLWREKSTSSLPLLFGLLWPGVVLLVRFSSTDQADLLKNYSVYSPQKKKLIRNYTTIWISMWSPKLLAYNNPRGADFLVYQILFEIFCLNTQGEE